VSGPGSGAGSDTTDGRYERGLRVRREVLGDAHVDRSVQAVSDFARPVQEYVTENVWGELWSRPGGAPAACSTS
jgi:4-carboxymuconolactone decarboxylase